ncbi:MAG: Uma2 family endonuclease [Blastocatellia bacterium]
MSSQTEPRYTPRDYLALERRTEQRSEYFNGEIFAMSGASESHGLIVGNVAASLHTQMKAKPYKVYASNMRLKVSETGLYTYPDVVALCGEARFDDDQRDTLVNPSVIIEVLSKSTEGYDRGEKSAQYRKIESLLQYVLISQDKNHLESYVRQTDNRWRMSEITQSQREAGASVDSIHPPDRPCFMTGCVRTPINEARTFGLRCL